MAIFVCAQIRNSNAEKRRNERISSWRRAENSPRSAGLFCGNCESYYAKVQIHEGKMTIVS